MILKHTRFFTGFIHYVLQEKICNTIKDLNTRKYASLEVVIDHRRKEGKMEDFSQEEGRL